MPDNQCDHSNDHQIKYAGNHALANARVFRGIVGVCSVKRICHPISFRLPGLQFRSKRKPEPAVRLAKLAVK